MHETRQPETDDQAHGGGNELVAESTQDMPRLQHTSGEIERLLIATTERVKIIERKLETWIVPGGSDSGTVVVEELRRMKNLAIRTESLERRLAELTRPAQMGPPTTGPVEQRPQQEINGEASNNPSTVERFEPPSPLFPERKPGAIIRARDPCPHHNPPLSPKFCGLEVKNLPAHHVTEDEFGEWATHVEGIAKCKDRKYHSEQLIKACIAMAMTPVNP